MGADALYFIDNDPPTLYSLNTATAAATVIGSPECGGMDQMVFENGVLLGAVAFPPYSLCILNISTGAGTVGTPLPYQITGLAPLGLIPTPLSLTFPSRDVGTISPAKVVKVANVSPATVTVSGITTTGDFSPVDNPCRSPLAPGAQCAIKVTFTPTQFGKRTGSLIIASGAPGSPQTVALTGTGLGSGANVTPKSLNFGTQAIGTDSPPQTATLLNNGNQTLNISNISATPPFNVASTTCGATLAAKASCTISVTFRSHEQRHPGRHIVGHGRRTHRFADGQSKRYWHGTLTKQKS